MPLLAISQINTLGLIGAITGPISLIASAITIWFNFFRPSKIKGGFSYLALKRYSSLRNGNITQQFLLFNFFLRNVGTKPAIIEAIRIKFNINNTAFYSYPTRTVPLEALENTAAQETSFPPGGTPFCGVIMCKDEIWKNNYIFSMSVDSSLKLEGTGTFSLEVKIKGKWKTIEIFPYRYLRKNSFGKIIMSNCDGDQLFLWSAIEKLHNDN